MCKSAFEAESKIIDWIFEKGELDFLPKKQINEFIKDRFNRSLKSIEIEPIFETDELPMQTWNNIIINYDGGTLDVFINNKMVASEPNIIPYLSQDKITLGQKN